VRYDYELISCHTLVRSYQSVSISALLTTVALHCICMSIEYIGVARICDWRSPGFPTGDCQCSSIFTCVSYAEARNRYSLDVRPSVRHTLALYQNG